jgi:hypothetical protein
MILRGRDGRPRLDISESDSSGVISEIEITYGVGGMHVARCDQASSDDGRGYVWGAGEQMPYSTGVRPSELCQYSVTRFGPRPVFSLNLPYVDSPYFAANVGMYFLGRFFQTERLLRLAASKRLHDLLPGMVFKLNNDLTTRFGFIPPLWKEGTTWGTAGTMDGVWWMCTGNERQQMQGDSHRRGAPAAVDVQLISAIALPYQIGEEFGPSGIVGGGSVAEESYAMEGAE